MPAEMMKYEPVIKAMLRTEPDSRLSVKQARHGLKMLMADKAWTPGATVRRKGKEASWELYVDLVVRPSRAYAAEIKAAMESSHMPMNPAVFLPMAIKFHKTVRFH